MDRYLKQVKYRKGEMKASHHPLEWRETPPEEWKLQGSLLQIANTADFCKFQHRRESI